MINKRLNNRGFSASALVIIIVVLVLGFAGWYVWDSNKEDSGNNQTNNSTNNDSDAATRELSDDRAAAELRQIETGLVTHYADWGYYPLEIGPGVFSHPSLGSEIFVDETGKPYEYLTENCDDQGCAAYTLRYEYYTENPTFDYDNDGYEIKSSQE